MNERVSDNYEKSAEEVRAAEVVKLVELNEYLLDRVAKEQPKDYGADYGLDLMSEYCQLEQTFKSTPRSTRFIFKPLPL